MNDQSTGLASRENAARYAQFQPGQQADQQMARVATLHGMAMDHAAAQQPPPDSGPPTNDLMPPPDPLAVQAQAHGQMMDRAKLGLQAQAQAHQQAMDVAQHGLAVKQANQPPPAPGP